MADAAHRFSPTHTLDDLTGMRPAELHRLYAEAGLPASLSPLDGAPPGRMLAVAGPLGKGPFFGRVRQLAAQRWFPWAGKSFRSVQPRFGEGINRVRLGRTRDWYPFHTRFEDSVVDGRPCIFLDYDLEANPWFIRHIRDELREVSPGLFLGPALWRGRRGYTHVLHFAIDATSAR